jgi:hypothetical protein
MTGISSFNLDTLEYDPALLGATEESLKDGSLRRRATLALLEGIELEVIESHVTLLSAQLHQATPICWVLKAMGATMNKKLKL